MTREAQHVSGLKTNIVQNYGKMCFVYFEKTRNCNYLTFWMSENNLREINLSKGEGKLPGSITRVER